MESQLLNGRYTAEDAEKLLSRLFKVKTDFHIAKIDTVGSSEEDIKLSETKIKGFENEQRRISKLLKQGSYKHVSIRANILFEFSTD